VLALVVVADLDGVGVVQEAEFCGSSGLARELNMKFQRFTELRPATALKPAEK
jgi:hypothetical protein